MGTAVDDKSDTGNQGFHLDWHSDSGVGKANIPPQLLTKILDLASKLSPKLEKRQPNKNIPVRDTGLWLNTDPSLNNFASRTGKEPFRRLAPVDLRTVVNNAFQDKTLIFKRPELKLMLALVEIGEDLRTSIAPNKGILDIAGFRDYELSVDGPRFDFHDLNLSAIMIDDGTRRKQAASLPQSDGVVGLRLAVSLEPTEIYIPEIDPSGIAVNKPIGDDRVVTVFDSKNGIHSSPGSLTEKETTSTIVVFEYMPPDKAPMALND
jgi:hypothetical protein